MEKYTAFLEVTPYFWLTLVTLCLGGVGALATVRAEKRRYPAIFRRRRTGLVLLYLLIAAVAVPLSIFVPGPERFPPLAELLLYLFPLTLFWAVVFRFRYIGIPLAAIVLGLLVWAESAATKAFVFAEEGRAIAFFDVREVQQGRIDLFVELPLSAGRRLLAEESDSSFPLSLESDDLALSGGEVRLHPFLWWRYPSRGVRIEGFRASSRAPEPFGTLTPRSEQFLNLLEALGLARRRQWGATLPGEEILLTRYELRLEAQGVATRRAVVQSD